MTNLTPDELREVGEFCSKDSSGMPILYLHIEQVTAKAVEWADKRNTAKIAALVEALEESRKHLRLTGESYWLAHKISASLKIAQGES